MLANWTEWLPFPDPRKLMFIVAPFGPGVYEVKRVDTNELILRGSGKNCAYRMSSLLPIPWGQALETMFKNAFMSLKILRSLSIDALRSIQQRKLLISKGN